jgi:hypothetical protein
MKDINDNTGEGYGFVDREIPMVSCNTERPIETWKEG